MGGAKPSTDILPSANKWISLKNELLPVAFCLLLVLQLITRYTFVFHSIPMKFPPNINDIHYLHISDCKKNRKKYVKIRKKIKIYSFNLHIEW